MSASKVEFIPSLTFVSISGPTLDHVNAKAMRAHTTRANFARRRLRLVQEYANQTKRATPIEPLQNEEDGKTASRDPVVDHRPLISSHIRFDRNLNGTDAFFINFLMDAMRSLYLLTNTPASDTAFAVVQSDWARFLPDPTMLDVSLFFARHVYAARRQHQPVQLAIDVYEGKAIRSVRLRLSDESRGLTNSLIAAILLLTLLDQVLGNMEAWKIHIAGLSQIIKVRSRNSDDIPTHLISHAIPRTILQGLLLFSQHDMTLLTTIEKTGILDAMFSAPAKKATSLIVANAEQVATLHYAYIQDRHLLISEQLWLNRIINSLDAAIQLNSNAHTREAFITATALSIIIFLEIVLRHTTGTKEGLEDTAAQLVEVLHQPEQQLPSSLGLCSSLELVFWQTMMGAIASADTQAKCFYTSRLRRITIALGLTSWHDASVILQRFFWIPFIFSVPCYQIFSEVLLSQSRTDA